MTRRLYFRRVNSIPRTRNTSRLGIKSYLGAEMSRESNDFRVRRQSCKTTRFATCDAISETRPIDRPTHPVLHHLCAETKTRKKGYRSCFIYPRSSKNHYTFAPHSLPIRCITRLTVLLDPALFNPPCGTMFRRICFLIDKLNNICCNGYKLFLQKEKCMLSNSSSFFFLRAIRIATDTLSPFLLFDLFDEKPRE